MFAFSKRRISASVTNEDWSDRDAGGDDAEVEVTSGGGLTRKTIGSLAEVDHTPKAAVRAAGVGGEADSAIRMF
jgi:hypothetical protein